MFFIFIFLKFCFFEQDFPPVSKLDPSIYGPQESALREEHIKGHLDGMSVQQVMKNLTKYNLPFIFSIIFISNQLLLYNFQAIEEDKLFILDFHDIYLPFLNQINSLDDRKSYGTRTIFLLTSMGTLKPIAIELSLPPVDSNSPSKQVLTPPVDATTNWLWQLGKAHVCSNDSGVHQLVHHWYPKTVPLFCINKTNSNLVLAQDLYNFRQP